MTRPETFPALVDHVAGQFGDRVFLPRQDSGGGEPVTYRRLREQVRCLAAALLERGMRPGDRIAIIAENSYRWILSDLASSYVGLVDVPRGADTAPDELREILAHSGARIALAQDDACVRELLALQDSLPALEQVITMRDASEVADIPCLPALLADGEQRLRQDDGRAVDQARDAVRPDSLLTLVYTSGTTAEPKGVMLTHDNVISNIYAVAKVLHVQADDTFLSLLPAWHVYERIMDYLAMAHGSQLIYTDRRRLKDDLAALRPTVLAAVPRVWESLHDAMVNKCEKLRGARRRLLLHVLSNAREVGGRRAGPVGRLAHSLYSATVLKAFRNALGGRLRFAVSGGGALPPHIDECLLGIGLPLLNGYGLTETSPVVAVRRPWDRRPRTIGPPLCGTEVEIRDDEGRPLPDGETGVLWIRGPQVMQGYYNNPSRTAEVLRGGWFNTGDLGHKDARGNLYITGRAKDTIVLASGENVEPEPLETAIKTSSLIDQAVVLGQDQKHLGAILVPMAEVLEEMVPRQEWDEREGFLHGERVCKLIRRELDQVLCRQRGFRPCENIARFKLRLEPMTQENELLTPTMKVRRHVVADRFHSQIVEMFDGQ